MLRSAVVVCLVSLWSSQISLAQGLSPAEAVRRMKPAPGFEVQLVASEPDLANPVAFAIDGKGRVYVAETFRIKDGVFDDRETPTRMTSARAMSWSDWPSSWLIAKSIAAMRAK